MGGSLGLALKRYVRHVRVIGVSRTSRKIRRARRIGAIDVGTTSIARAMREADLAVICTPVRTIAGFVRVLDRSVTRNVVVTDVGSTKSTLMSAFAKHRLKHVRFVGSHPMAGWHETGLDAARHDLYRGACVFVSAFKSDPAARKVEALWQSVGAHVQRIAPDAHDRIVARISQLPHLLAVLLVAHASPHFLRHAGSGFRDSTRIAQGDAGLWLDIVATNRRHLARELDDFGKRLRVLARAVRTGDETFLYRLLHQVSAARRRLDRNVRGHDHRP